MSKKTRKQNLTYYPYYLSSYKYVYVIAATVHAHTKLENVVTFCDAFHVTSIRHCSCQCVFHIVNNSFSVERTILIENKEKKIVENMLSNLVIGPEKFVLFIGELCR